MRNTQGAPDHVQSFELLSSVNPALLNQLEAKACANTKVSLAFKIFANSPPLFKAKPGRVTRALEITHTGPTSNPSHVTTDATVAAPGGEGSLCVTFSRDVSMWMDEPDAIRIAINLKDLSCRISSDVWRALSESDQQSVIFATFPPDLVRRYNLQGTGAFSHSIKPTTGCSAGDENGPEARHAHDDQIRDNEAPRDYAHIQAKIEELSNQLGCLNTSVTELRTKQRARCDCDSSGGTGEGASKKWYIPWETPDRDTETLDTQPSFWGQNRAHLATPLGGAGEGAFKRGYVPWETPNRDPETLSTQPYSWGQNRAHLATPDYGNGHGGFSMDAPTAPKTSLTEMTRNPQASARRRVVKDDQQGDKTSFQEHHSWGAPADW
ncbi:hypothetical protein FDECE_17224 [Fusarium decemcellulare]|nr:hypothetical protein FDECE_17224 [Fusarium decemcellulare]